MKETIQVNQEGEQPSFFKIDPENWSNLPSLVIPKEKYWKPRIKGGRRRYKLTGLVNFNDPVLQKPQTPAVVGRWQIPQSRLKSLEARKEKTQVSKILPPERGIHAEAIKLIRRFQAGEIDLDEVRSFYYQNAENLVDRKPYQAYVSYTTENLLKTMSWSEYARQRAQDLFINDLSFNSSTLF